MSLAFALALLAAGVMGLALQRGATCMVAAMDELVHQRRATRLLALVEAAFWVGAGLLILQALSLQPRLPPPPTLGGWTVLGAVLLAMGALLNGACVLGALARLGSGEWAYLATPLGFYAGCLSLPWLLSSVMTVPTQSIMAMPSGTATAAHPATGTPLLQLPHWGLWLLVALALARLAWALRPRLVQRRWFEPWTPHAATAVIAIAFLLLLVLAGAWSYTDVLSELAHQTMNGMTADLATRAALGLALLGGTFVGGWSAGLWPGRVPRLSALARCLAGGWLLGCGSLLVPGGNDSLVLLGMPLLWPHAWISVGVMCGVIGSVMLAQRRLRVRGVGGVQVVQRVQADAASPSAAPEMPRSGSSQL